MLYQIKIINSNIPILNFFLNKKIKRVKGHFVSNEFNNQYLVIVLESEERVLYNLTLCKSIKISKEFILNVKQDIEKESGRKI